MEKTLDNSNLSDAKGNISDLKVVGEDLWTLLCKASSKHEGWMKSTKAMEVKSYSSDGLPYAVSGCLVQVTTQQGDHVAEALTYIPLVMIKRNENGGGELISA